MFQRIVAAIDNDEERSQQVLQATREMGKRFGAHVLIVHVRDVDRTATMVAAAGRAGLPPAITFESEEAAQRLVDDAVQQLRAADISAQGRLSHGHASTARELLDIADSYRADLIIAGDRDSRVTDILLGGVAHRIVHLAHCPVLLIR